MVPKRDLVEMLVFLSCKDKKIYISLTSYGLWWWGICIQAALAYAC
jgi:hypothetical protein